MLVVTCSEAFDPHPSLFVNSVGVANSLGKGTMLLTPFILPYKLLLFNAYVGAYINVNFHISLQRNHQY